MDPLTLLGIKAGGDLLSGATSYFGNKSKMEKEREALNKLIEGENVAYGTGKAYYDYLESQYGPEAAAYLSDLDMLRDAQMKDPVALGEFDDSGYTVEKYLDPYSDYAQQQARKQIEQSAAARGGMFAGSGATAKALQDRAMQLGGQFYGDAADMMQEERSFGYGKFKDKFTADRQTEQDRLSRLTDLTDRSGAARDNLFGAKGGAADLEMSKIRSIADLQAGKSRAEGDFYKNTWDTVGGGIKSTMGGGAAGLSSKSGGGDSLASRLGLDVSSMSDDDKMGLLKLLMGGK